MANDDRGNDRNAQQNTSGSDREKYRDNDDVRDPVAPDDRVGTSPDTKNEARGDARENIGNTAHDRKPSHDR